jgi:hypothetical protein
MKVKHSISVAWSARNGLSVSRQNLLNDFLVFVFLKKEKR